MSKIIVKNLPPKITEEELKSHFSEVGTVTDSKIIFKNGKSRGFAFIGYKTSTEASAACSHFMDTYIQQYQIRVEISKKFNPNELQHKHNLKKEESPSINKVPATTGTEESKKNKYDFLFTIVIRTKEQNTNKKKHGKTFQKKTVKSFLKPLKYQSLRIPRDISYVAYVGFKLEKDMKQALQKDNGFLDGVRVRIQKYEEPQKPSVNDNIDRWEESKKKIANADPIEDSGKLFVRNLWYSTKEEDIREFFGKIGPLADVTLPICKMTRQPKGFAHVFYVLPEHATKALNQLDGTTFQGRTLHILPSIITEENDEEKETFKEKKEKEKKKKNSWQNWNSLFLSPDSVANLTLESLGKSKKQLYDDEGQQSAAATLALGETKIVEETKRFLESEGVSLDSFQNPDVQRSSTVLLVKRLPIHTNAWEIEEVFSKEGQLGRVVLPPSGITAIVEYLDPSEAKKAHYELALDRFKSTPLYLEWAPIQTFSDPPPPPKPQSRLVADESEKESPSSSETTLYVKNFNFNTTEDAINEHFSAIGDIYTVRIVKKRNLSQGYGFVQYIKSKHAKKALRKLQDSTLDGHNLYIKMSDKNFIPKNCPNFEIEGKKAPVIIVKNIPFESPLSEIRDIFKVFGEISAIRLPRHLDNQGHKGFCFVDYLYKQSAKSAFDALSLSTHLRGRRLVLEWAKDKESVEDIQKRTAEHFLSSGSGKRRKVVLEEEPPV